MRRNLSVCALTAAGLIWQFRPLAFAQSATEKANATFVSTQAKGCREAHGELHQPIAKGYLLDIRPTPDQDESCSGDIVDSYGHCIYHTDDFAVGLDDATGKDINGDGIPDLVIENFSGGAHCCDKYDFISLTETPKQVMSIQTNHPVQFRMIGKRIVFSAEEGSFDYFETDYADHPYVEVFLRIDGDELVDVSSQFLREYDKVIADARKGISEQDLDKFRRTGEDPEEGRVKGSILTVVLGYLYSGRDQKAWQALEEMWPAKDQERIKNAIRDARSNGILLQLGKYESQ